MGVKRGKRGGRFCLYETLYVNLTAENILSEIMIKKEERVRQSHRNPEGKYRELFWDSIIPSLSTPVYI